MNLEEIVKSGSTRDVNKIK